jgi:hypothetical protein
MFKLKKYLLFFFNYNLFIFNFNLIIFYFYLFYFRAGNVFAIGRGKKTWISLPPAQGLWLNALEDK